MDENETQIGHQVEYKKQKTKKKSKLGRIERGRETFI